MYPEYEENNEQYFEKFKSVQVLVKRDFIVEKKRANKYIIMTNGFKYCEYSTQPKQNYDKYSEENKKKRYEYSKVAIPLIAQVKKQVNAYLIKKGNDIPVLERRHSPVFRNRDAWDKLPDETEMKYIDINHCYWRLAYLQGVISEKFYSKTLKKTNSKQYRNIALASMIAPRTRTYYVRGVDVLEIEEVTDIYKTVYSNIRYSASNLLGDLAAQIEGYCYNFRTDGMLVHKDKVDFIAAEFKKRKLPFTITDCQKVSATHFYNGETEKQF